MAWSKGQSGNPSGRPKIVGELRDLARVHTTDALETLVSICNDSEAPPASRVAAAAQLLDRGYGRPSQSIDSKIEVIDMGKAHAEALWELSRRAKEQKSIEAQPIDITPTKVISAEPS